MSLVSWYFLWTSGNVVLVVVPVERSGVNMILSSAAFSAKNITQNNISLSVYNPVSMAPTCWGRPWGGVGERDAALPWPITSLFTVTQLTVIFYFFLQCLTPRCFLALDSSCEALKEKEKNKLFAACFLQLNDNSESPESHLFLDVVGAGGACRKVSLTACSLQVIWMTAWCNSKVVIWERHGND